MDFSSHEVIIPIDTLGQDTSNLYQAELLDGWNYWVGHICDIDNIPSYMPALEMIRSRTRIHGSHYLLILI